MDYPLIEFNNVFYQYPNTKVNTLKSINFKINSGDYIAISGTSGSGKSTLLSILGLLNLPSEGQYTILGTNTAELTPDAIATIKNREFGFIFQNFNLLNHLSVFDNVALPLSYNKSVSRNDYQKKVETALNKVNMLEFINTKPNQLSGGQQQRVAIARALINEPSIILADEPTGNLDSNNSDKIYQLLNKLNHEGKTICLITHDENHAKTAKTRMYIQDGNLSAQGY
ncbi:Macrolide export ATP-binding/permease protein MacB [Pseudoalteromonas sp. P1-16-1b]|uniref:ABC transporter ATP-binding protein n=1 Tax=unclassified Pseudoalteromonas TaxID=194690 RepID=UPI0006D6683A|nr:MULTISPECIES: ABC transporter ATP-binding protein [unclassified Pseudoalteromonas]KPZ63185.1 Macrolide export ATP-binding/permease protein MacB [Pseudoalteromonas sp. P1-16-1b]TMP75524.1 ABC transporter ATP-binding protein [Pseudoalteromonas sp. S1608]|tara:strand:+ start:1584 stop:2264 length:681 start_codon:yes stop_codon:yes gene_type:complete